MPDPSHARPGPILSTEGGGTPGLIRDLQRDLRRLGYLRRTVDGVFGPGTRRAVAALQYDLLHNDGRSRETDGAAPVRVMDYNGGRVTAVTGVVDPLLAACIAEMLADPAYPRLPESADPAAANRAIVDGLASGPADPVPPPFLLAVLQQETGLMHWAVPRPGDEDSFVIVGTDLDPTDPDVIVSRGYGIGQYTLFHHPPRPEEVAGFISRPEENVRQATTTLREKFDRFVRGPVSSADDRVREHGDGPVRPCIYGPDDSRHHRDCRSCAATAGTRDIPAGGPAFDGSPLLWRASPPVHPEAGYTAVPRRERFPCDWPYAARRYNGSGIDSYHYQAKVLLHLTARP